MKRMLWVVTLVLTAAVAVVGCAKKGVDTSKVEKSFATSSDPGTKSDVDKAVSAAKAGDYAGALASLQQVAAKAKLTPDQQQALNDLIDQVQKQLAETAQKATAGAQKSVSDMQKSLGK